MSVFFFYKIILKLIVYEGSTIELENLHFIITIDIICFSNQVSIIGFDKKALYLVLLPCISGDSFQINWLVWHANFVDINQELMEKIQTIYCGHIILCSMDYSWECNSIHTTFVT